jgi:uncharacterized protein (TIGR03437 family)
MDVAHNRIPVSKSALLILTAVLLLAAPRIALAQTLSVSSATVSLTGTEGASVTVSSSDNTTPIAYTASVSGGSWLSISGSGYPSGTTPSQINFQFSICPGCSSATATVTLKSTSPASTATITVNWVPQGSGGGGGGGTGGTTITPSTTSVTWNNSAGSTSSTTISLTSSSTTGISYSLYTSVNWLTVTPTTGTVYATSPASLALQFNSSGLQAGTQTGYIYVTYGTTTFTITVSFTVITSNVLTISPTTASWGYTSGGTVPYTDLAVTSGTTYISAVSNASWILLTWPGAPSTYTPQPSLQYVQASLGLRVIYNTLASIPSSGSQGTVTITDTNGNTSTFTVTFTGGGVVGSTISTPNLLVAPSTLSFSADVNNPASISPQYLTVADAGSFTASVTNGSQWLSLGATSGYSSGTASPALLEVIANPAGLTAGTYTGTVSVSSPSGTTSISVTMQVYSAATIYATTAAGNSGGFGTLNITEIAGNISGTVPNVYVYASNSSIMSVQASTSTSWLEVIPASGTTPNAQFDIIFLASSLTNGVYVGTVTFTSTSAANPTLTVPVVLTVASSSIVSGLTLTQNSLSMSSTVNGTSMSQQLGITSSTATSFTASSNAAWLTLNTSSGTATSSTTYITVTANPSGLTAGTYSGTITVSGGGSTATASVTFTVTGSGSTGGGNVVSSPTSLTFNYQVNGSLPASQSLTISNAVSGTSQILFTVAVNSAATGWLTATAGGGGTQAYTQSTVTVSVTPGSLSAATYSGTVTITPSGSGSILSIPVTLNILGPPVVTATPSSLTFAYQAGGTIPPSQAVQVSGSTSGLTYSATPTMTSGTNWLVVSKTSGTTGSTGQDVLSVSVTPTSLAVGAYQGSLLIQGTGNASGSATISVVLTVTAPAPTITSVLHAASYQSGAIAPGEIVSIFGTAMGPASPLGTTLDSTGKVATTLGNVTVLFNGYAAPLTYVSATQINCVVPYELAQLSSPYVEVKYLNQTSNIYSLRAVTTAPGIFTLSNGTGQGAFLNYDNSYNSASHPAAAGSVIQLYLTGEGQLSPAGVTGSVTCSAGCATVNQIPLPLLAVAALVNNQPATIAFAREAPGDVSGVMQVNVIIPPNTPSGPIPIVISVGGNSSQSGVTVYVQ